MDEFLHGFLAIYINQVQGLDEIDHGMLQQEDFRARRSSNITSRNEKFNQMKNSTQQCIEFEKETYSTIAPPPLRPYQTEIIDFAKDNNAVVVLPTGSGKTLIAYHTAKHYIQKARNEGTAKPAYFVVANVSLLFHQARVLRSYGLSCQCMCGEKRSGTFFESNCEVIFITAGLLMEYLKDDEKRVWANCSLLILDEAHHGDTEKNHPFSVVLRSFYKTYLDFRDHEVRFPCFAMTASPVHNLSSLVEGDVIGKFDQWLKPFGGSIAPLHDSIFDYSPNISIEFLDASLSRDETFVHHDIIAQTFCEFAHIFCNDDFWALGKITTEEVESQFQRVFGTIAGKKTVTVKDEILYDFLMNLLDAYELVTIVSPDWAVKRVLYVTYLFLKRMMDEELFEPQDIVKSKNVVINNIARPLHEHEHEHGYGPLAKSSTRCDVLVDTIEKHKNTIVTENNKVLIFCYRREEVYLLARTIRERCSDLNVVILCGRSEMTASEQEAACREMKGTAHVMIATSVAEEGLDFSQCHYVFRYDDIQSVRALIQSRGRARTKNGYFYMFRNRFSNLDHDIKHYVRQEREIQVAVHVLARKPIGNDEIFKLYKEERELMMMRDSETILQGIVDEYCNDLMVRSFNIEYEWDDGGDYAEMKGLTDETQKHFWENDNYLKSFLKDEPIFGKNRREIWEKYSEALDKCMKLTNTIDIIKRKKRSSVLVELRENQKLRLTQGSLPSTMSDISSTKESKSGQNPISQLNEKYARMKVDFQCEGNQPFVCHVYVNDKLLGTGRGFSKKIAKQAAAAEALGCEAPIMTSNQAIVGAGAKNKIAALNELCQKYLWNTEYNYQREASDHHTPIFQCEVVLKMKDRNTLKSNGRGSSKKESKNNAVTQLYEEHDDILRNYL
eukprot:TRINITY_DN31323_c0_g1_i1.p1 TRINITY_DN31323_c0_g1~~TRINITY_DN31323_c0_g1_i1.p1  ORF type:complete len:897 (-),score=185.79 TRINITY_DN31323_c0_g1_i1:692-3382(-)